MSNTKFDTKDLKECLDCYVKDKATNKVGPKSGVTIGLDRPRRDILSLLKIFLILDKSKESVIAREYFSSEFGLQALANIKQKRLIDLGCKDKFTKNMLQSKVNTFVARLDRLFANVGDKCRNGYSDLYADVSEFTIHEFRLIDCFSNDISNECLYITLGKLSAKLTSMSGNYINNGYTLNELRQYRKLSLVTPYITTATTKVKKVYCTNAPNSTATTTTSSTNDSDTADLQKQVDDLTKALAYARVEIDTLSTKLSDSDIELKKVTAKYEDFSRIAMKNMEGYSELKTKHTELLAKKYSSGVLANVKVVYSNSPMPGSSEKLYQNKIKELTNTNKELNKEIDNMTLVLDSSADVAILVSNYREINKLSNKLKAYSGADKIMGIARQHGTYLDARKDLTVNEKYEYVAACFMDILSSIITKSALTKLVEDITSFRYTLLCERVVETGCKYIRC